MVNDLILRWYCKCSVYSQKLLLPALGAAALLSASPEAALAAEGDTIFKDATCTLLESVITNTFGGMLTAIAGGLAIIASVQGAFKAAWALVFVSVGCFIFPEFVDIFFDPNCGGGG